MNVVLQPRLKGGSGVYDEMARVSRRSYEQYLAQPWEYREHWQGNWTSLWISVFNECHALSRNGDNIFLVGTDTLAVKPIEVFGKYTQLTMFWYTDPPKRAPYNNGYMNSEPIYIPANLSEDLWTIGVPRVNDMEHESHYDRIQEIWNDMYWSQTPVPEKDPTMNWSPIVASDVPEHEAKIIHYHASRSPDGALQAMKRRAGAPCG